MFKPLICTALVLASGLAFAQHVNPDRDARHAEWKAKAEARFAAADKDRSGRLDRVEAQAVGERLAKHFDRIDANRDGGLDQTELADARRKMNRGGHRMKAMMAHQRGLFIGMDDDADGAITRAELGTKHKRWAEDFEIIDVNRDSKLTGEELKAYGRATLQAHRAERKA